MAKSFWTTGPKRPEDYYGADEPDSAYPPALRAQADAAEAKVVKLLANRKPGKPPKKPIQA